jgi:hypothetical protein
MSEAYGKAPGWRVESYRVDRNGGVTLELALPWEPIVKGANDGLISVPKAPSAPKLDGYGVIGGGWKRTNDGGMAVVYSYGSVDQEFNGKPGKDIGVVWSVAGSFRGRSILTHPNLKTLKEKYGWDDVKRAFPEKMPAAAAASSSWAASSSSEGKLSDAYGITSYDDLSAVLTKTYFSARVPAGVLAGAGRVIKKPWAELDDFDDDRNWLQLPGTADPHGNYYRIVISYLLSGPGGHNTDIYGSKALAATDRLRASTPRLDAAF